MKRTVAVLQYGGTLVNDHSSVASWAASLAAMASAPNPLETHIKSIMNFHGNAAGPIAHILGGFFLER